MAEEGAAMLCEWSPREPSEFDRQIFELVVPSAHHLRKALKAIDWDGFEEQLACYYCPDRGRPASGCRSSHGKSLPSWGHWSSSCGWFLLTGERMLDAVKLFGVKQ